MRFEYPIKISADTEEGIEDKVVTLMGSRNQMGFYPIGRLNNWHGGIHVEGQAELLAIADGRVIAYRLPKKYLVETIEGTDHEYSNGFVLIQHDYKSPKGLELTFYSLYHHVCCYDELIEDDKKIPDFIIKSAFMVKGTTTIGGVKGEHYKSSVAATSNLDFLSNGTEITKVGEPSGNFQKITSASITANSAFIKKTSIAATVASTNLDIVKNCDKPIKAGTLVGHTGMYGFEKKANYRASHVEVFTADSVADLLNGKSEDIAESKNYLKIIAGKELKKVTPYSIKKGWNIRILEAGATYSKIQQSELIGTVIYDDLDDDNKQNAEGKYYYTSKAGDSLIRNNNVFESLLNSKSILVREEALTEGGIKKRKVKLAPTDTRTYWIANPNLPVETTSIRKLTTDLTELFDQDPSLELTQKINSDVIIRKNRVKKEEKDRQDVLWYKVEVSYLKDGVREHKKGWIKESDVPAVSAYNWKEFGFSTLEDLNDKFVYEFEETPPFLKKILNEIDTVEQEQDDYDTDEKGKLTVFELRSALSKTHIANGLSRLVCKHTSEWGCESATVKSEVTTYLDKGINKEEDAVKKEAFKKKKQQILDSIDLRITKLNIWNEVQKGALATTTTPTATTPAPSTPASTPASTTTPPRKFPSEKKVFHFHPIAFVEQMKRMERCYCNRDITSEQFEEIFGSGPWFTSKAKYANMSLYPDIYKMSTQSLVAALNKAMNESGIKTCYQKAHFLSQCGHESANFTTTQEFDEGLDYDPGTHKEKHDKFQEYLNFLKKYGGNDPDKQQDIINQNYEICKAHYDTYEANKNTPNYDLSPYKVNHDKYAPFLIDKNKYTPYKAYEDNYDRYRQCTKMGNENNGDGIKYKGKGLLQLTWKKNYEKFKTEKGIDCVTSPTLIASNLENAVNVSTFHWIENSAWGNLNTYANKDDFIYITIGVNGGLNGLKDRFLKVKQSLKTLNASNCAEIFNANPSEYSYENSAISDTKYGRDHQNFIKKEIQKL